MKEWVGFSAAVATLLALLLCVVKWLIKGRLSLDQVGGDGIRSAGTKAYMALNAVFKICFIIGITGVVVFVIIWFCLEIVPKIDTEMEKQEVLADGPYYLKSHPLSEKEEEVRKQQVEALKKSVSGMISYDRGDAIANSVVKIPGGVTGKELVEIIKSGDSWLSGRRMSHTHRRQVIILLAKHLMYPLGDDLSALVAGLPDSDRAACVKAMMAREEKTMKFAKRWSQLMDAARAHTESDGHENGGKQGNGDTAP